MISKGQQDYETMTARLEALQSAVDEFCKEEDVYYSVKCIPPDHVKQLFKLRTKRSNKCIK